MYSIQHPQDREWLGTDIGAYWSLHRPLEETCHFDITRRVQIYSSMLSLQEFPFFLKSKIDLHLFFYGMYVVFI